MLFSLFLSSSTAINGLRREHVARSFDFKMDGGDTLLSLRIADICLSCSAEFTDDGMLDDDDDDDDV